MPRTLFVTFSLISTAFYAARFWQVFAAGELFHRLGFDWSLSFAQALAVRAGAGAGMYDIGELNVQLQSLQRYYPGGSTSLGALPLPYPPWFAAALVPLTFLPAPIAFALWLAGSLLAALVLAYRVWQFLPDLGRIGAVAAVLAAVPVAWALFLGQITVLLALAAGEMLVSFKARRDFTAGLWLSVLLFKPQYAVLFALLILFKLRWRAIAGATVGGLVLLLFAALVA
ncbi:MAG: DUF2029 domain-containing protein, partial [Chloroflexi bacterium]|nr:DUF2029 domain-containing protein [Chloroflexota bacterium]